MLQMRPNCENCDCDLPAEEPGAMICSLECTWCAPCAAIELQGACPNCGGMLSPRPTREGQWLKKYPASTQRVNKDGERGD